MTPAITHMIINSAAQLPPEQNAEKCCCVPSSCCCLLPSPGTREQQKISSSLSTFLVLLFVVKDNKIKRNFGKSEKIIDLVLNLQSCCVVGQKLGGWATES